ncbi:MAG: hypothetical protein QNK37_11505 [Acidobacteriota bacterium]|nr:hypothetical protein [Acidobacteriota bacterium]
MGIFLILLLGSSWKLTGTDIYRGFTSERVVNAGKNGWFLLDSQEQRILHYDISGKYLKQVSKRGEGPGEINQANKIQFFDNHLYAIAQSRVWVFNSSGMFIRKMLTPKSLDLEKIPGGWLGLPSPLSILESNEIIFLNEGLEPISQLCRWDEIIEKTPRRRRTQLPLKRDRACIAISPDRERLYLRRPGKSFIEVWDLLKRTRVSEMSLGVTLSLKDNLALHREAIEKKGLSIGIYSWLPELRCVPNGDIYFFSIPHASPPIAFDPNGRSLVPKYTLEDLDRLIDYEGGFFFVADRMPESGAYFLSRIPEGNLVDYLHSR